MSPPLPSLVELQTLPPLPVLVAALMPSILLVSLVLLLLLRGRSKYEGSSDATDSSTAREETPPRTPEPHHEEPASRLCKKHVLWWLGPWPFHEMPSRILQHLFRFLGCNDASALATTNHVHRKAVLRSLSTLTIAYRPKPRRADEEEEDDGSLLALFCQLNAEELTTLRVKRPGIATTAFLDALLEGPDVMPCLYSATLQTLTLNLSGCLHEETKCLLACLGQTDPATPLPLPNLTQLFLRNVPVGPDDDEEQRAGVDGEEAQGKDNGVGPAIAAMVEARAARGAIPLQRLGGVAAWRIDPASLRRILRVVLPSLRWLECGGGTWTARGALVLDYESTFQYMHPPSLFPYNTYISHPVRPRIHTHIASTAHAEALAVLAESLGGRRTRYRPGADALKCLSLSLPDNKPSSAALVASVLQALAAEAAPQLESLTLQGLGGEEEEEGEVWTALAAVLAAPAQHRLRSLTINDCRRGANNNSSSEEEAAQWRGLLGRLVVEAGVGEQGEWEGRANKRNVRIRLITKDYRCSKIVVLGKKYAGSSGDGVAEGRRRSKGRKS